MPQKPLMNSGDKEAQNLDINSEQDITTNSKTTADTSCDSNQYLDNKSTLHDTARNRRKDAPKTTSGIRGNRGGSRSGVTVSAASRFKPKNVRRSATQLAEIAQKEDIKKASIMAEYAREEAQLARGRRRQRGRGDMMGRGKGAIGSASSIFGVLPEEKTSGMLSIRSSGAGGLDSSRVTPRISVKKEETSNFKSSIMGVAGRSRNSCFEPQYPDEDENTVRIDIENINLVSEDETDLEYSMTSKASGKNKIIAKTGLKPVRLHREEHKERLTVINTASNLLVQPSPISQKEVEEGLFVTETTASPNEVRWKENETAVRRNQEISLEPAIKKELTLDESLNIAQLPSAVSSQTKTRNESLIASKLMTHDELNSSTLLDTSNITGTVATKIERDSLKYSDKCVKKNGRKFVIQSEEDRAEYERHLSDVEILVHELGNLQKADILRAQEIDEDKNESTENRGATQEEQDKKEGRLYLFQFPPVLPRLFNPLTEDKVRNNTSIKQENNQELESLHRNSIGKSKSKEDDLTAPTSNIKLEVEEELLFNQKEKFTERDDVVQEEGFIGKLIVRESGRVELCWGGTSLLVERGVDAGFLTTGVIVDSVEKGPTGGGVPEGKALGMGQIMGKFVVTPDWQTMA